MLFHAKAIFALIIDAALFRCWLTPPRCRYFFTIIADYAADAADGAIADIYACLRYATPMIFAAAAESLPLFAAIFAADALYATRRQPTRFFFAASALPIFSPFSPLSDAISPWRRHAADFRYDAISPLYFHFAFDDAAAAFAVLPLF